MAKRGRVAIAVCSAAFATLGRAQAAALGKPELAIAVIPHPFGNRTREDVQSIAQQCALVIAALAAAGETIER